MKYKCSIVTILAIVSFSLCWAGSPGPIASPVDELGLRYRGLEKAVQDQQGRIAALEAKLRDQGDLSETLSKIAQQMGTISKALDAQKDQLSSISSEQEVQKKQIKALDSDVSLTRILSLFGIICGVVAVFLGFRKK